MIELTTLETQEVDGGFLITGAVVGAGFLVGMGLAYLTRKH